MAPINLGVVTGDVIALDDPDLTDEQNTSLDNVIEHLVLKEWSPHQAAEAAPIMLGLTNGDVIEVDEE